MTSEEERRKKDRDLHKRRRDLGLDTWKSDNKERVCAQARKHYWDHVKEKREYARNYQAKRRAANPGLTRINLLRFKYGITPEDFDALVLSQGGVCAVCKTDDWGPHGPNVDHDHQGGGIRGVLCVCCNNAIGLLKDSPDRAIAASEYLLRYKNEGQTWN